MNKHWILSLFIFFTLQASATVATPSLSSPSNNYTLKNFYTFLYVSNQSGVSGFEFQVDTVNGFNSNALQSIATSGKFVNLPCLQANKSYYWRARAFNTGDTSAWCSSRVFTVYNQMELNTPANGSSGNVRAFYPKSWGYFDSVTYLYEMDTASSMNSSMKVSGSVLNNTLFQASLIQFGRTIYWRATAISRLGDTLEWSNVWSYTFNSTPTTYSNSTYQGPELEIDWAPLDSSFTVLQVDTFADFSSAQPFEKTIQIGINTDTLRELLFGRKYYWRIKASFNGSSSSWSAARTFTVRNIFLNPTPYNNSTSSSLIPYFSWDNYKGSKTQLQFSKDAAFTDLILDSSLQNTSLKMDDTLDLNTTYYWRIRGMHAKDTMPWQYLKLTTITGAVTQFYPANNAVNVEIKPKIQFYTVSGADSYYMEIDTGKVFLQTPSVSVIKASVFKTNGPWLYLQPLLKYGQPYVWRVFAISKGDTADITNSRTFTTKAVPTLYSPSNNSVGVGTETNGLITGIDSSSTVQWELDTNRNFNSSEHFTGYNPHVPDQFIPTKIEITMPVLLLFETKYFWRCRCISDVDTSAWTQAYNFTTTQRPWLSAPMDKAVDVPILHTLKWGVQGSAFDYGYQYQIGVDTNFTSLPIKTIGPGVAAEATVSGDYSTKYFWRIRVFHNRDTSSWSLVGSFTTVGPPVIPYITLNKPANGSVNVPIESVDLLWFTKSNATSYDVEVANDFAFTDVVSTGNTTGFGVVFKNMGYNRTYYWRVRMNLGKLNGPWCSPWKFTTAANTGLDDTESKGKISLYPNPATDVIRFNVATSFKLEIYNMQGQLLLQKEQVMTNENVDISSLPEGIYQILVTVGDAVIRKRLVISR